MNHFIKISIIVIISICSSLCFASCEKNLIQPDGTVTMPELTTTAVSNITQTGASGGGNINLDGGAAVTARGVCWGTSSNPDISASHTSDGTGTGSFSSSITGLTSGTAYHCRAYATNSAGTSYGSDVQFTTNSSGNNGLVIEGQTYVNTTHGEWLGVNIVKSAPIQFTFRNNSITSENSAGYLLWAGDEKPGSNNNHLDGQIITGNKFIWNGVDVASTITHGVFVGYNINWKIKYNYLYRVPTSIVLKSNGMTNTDCLVAYNIFITPGTIGIAVKGINGACVYNNTFYSSEERWSSNSSAGTRYGLVDVFANDGLSPWKYSTGTKIKNNVFYTVHQIPNINIAETQDLVGLESDYNIFYCEGGTPIFKIAGAEKTFAQWQALGYDTHSRIVNPNFINLTNFVPATRLDYGTNLGSTCQTGLSTTASWVVGSSPATANQNGTWQVGARIY